ncbi:helix-turn-helix domain-containing protein [Streptomyces sp. NPDC088254]|uniref:helix-turn-helix domain-containing protein n=1 Tax=Streptomyces sp. NPDC088254 TaxID=3365847 RepID=UPI00381D0AD8
MGTFTCTPTTAERQQFREGLRLKAAERFARGEASSVIAKDLRVSVRSVQRWRQGWEKDGPRALRSQGPASLPRLSEKQFAQLEAELAKGPTAHSWQDQRWTLGRSPQAPHRRASCPAPARARSPRPGPSARFRQACHAASKAGASSWSCRARTVACAWSAVRCICTSSSKVCATCRDPKCASATGRHRRAGV